MSRPGAWRWVLATVCAAGLTLAACGGGGDSSSASFCKDYAKLAGVSGTDEATLRSAAALYRKLAAEGPAEAKADFNIVADAEETVADGGAASVDNKAVGAAADRAGAVSARECANK